MSTSDSRLLEESFLPVLAAALGPSVALRTYNRLGTPGQPSTLPAVTVHAKYVDRNLTIKVGGVYASDFEFRLECRVDGTKPDSDREIEQLLKSVKVAQAGAGSAPSILTAWSYLRMVPQPDEPRFADNTRILTAVWLTTLLPV